MIELRWTRTPPDPNGYVRPDRLQWRDVDDDYQGEVILRDWTNVPIVPVSE